MHNFPKMKSLLKEKKGVAGLNVYLSLITMLFMIGVIVMVFLIAGSKLSASQTTTESGSAVNETVTTLNDTVGDYLSVYTLSGVACSVSAVKNATSGATIPATNYTMTNCLIKGVDGTEYMGLNVKVDYSYSYTAGNEATTSINATTNAIKTSTDFFPTFIVLGSMVVLVLLTVIIINSIRATGITQEGA